MGVFHFPEWTETKAKAKAAPVGSDCGDGRMMGSLLKTPQKSRVVNVIHKQRTERKKNTKKNPRDANKSVGAHEGPISSRS